MSQSIARGGVASERTSWKPPSLGSAARGLFAWYGERVRRLRDAETLAELDPRLARDIGAAPGCDRCPEGFTADPRPFWGIGLTPQPVDGRSP
jgi:hypothetical protein